MSILINPTDFNFVLKKMLSAGGEFSEIYFEGTETSGFSFIGGKVESASSGVIRGCGLRLMKNGETYFASQSSPSFSDLFRISAKLSGTEIIESPKVNAIKIKAPNVAKLTESLQPYLEVVEKIDREFLYQK